MERLDYAVSQKVIHWLMALIIMLDLVVAQKFGNPMEELDRLQSRSDHASLGTIVLVLFILRLFFRFRYGAPPLPQSMAPWQVRSAGAAHFLLYFFIGFLILSGLFTAMNAASPISLFGQLDITIGQQNEDTFSLIRGFHEFATNAVIALIALHFVAAVYHLFQKDGITTRMLKFWQSNSTTA